MPKPPLTEETDGNLGRIAILAPICACPLFIWFIYLGEKGRGIAAWVFASAILIVIKGFWDSRRRVWFWVAIATVVLLHIPLLLLVPWPKTIDSPGFAMKPILLPLVLLDLGVVIGCFKLVEKAMKGSGPASRIKI